LALVRAAHSRQKVSYETQEQQREEEAWVPLYYHGVDSEEATEERQLLFASDEEDHRGMFTVAQSEYLDMVCPMELPEERSAAAAPSGVVSLSQLKLLPVPQQVRELLKSSHVMQFQQLCTLLGGRGQAPALLEAVQGCGVLVQGCWVVSSKVVFPEKESSLLQNARDYIVSVHAYVCVHTLLCLKFVANPNALPLGSCGVLLRAVLWCGRTLQLSPRSPMKTSGTSCMLSRSRSQHKGGSSNYPLTRSLAASWFQPTTSFLVFCRHSTSSSDIPNIAG